jgi:uncharacterized Fe-S center protein
MWTVFFQVPKLECLFKTAGVVTVSDLNIWEGMRLHVGFNTYGNDTFIHTSFIKTICWFRKYMLRYSLKEKNY